MKKYIVTLNEEQRKFLIDLTSKGKESARTIKRAQILLLADEWKIDKEICEILHIGTATTERIRKKFVLEGLEAALYEKNRPGAPIKVDGRAEAIIIAKACSSPPEGYAKWSIRLLADKIIELNISKSTVQRTLKKMKLNRG